MGTPARIKLKYMKTLQNFSVLLRNHIHLLHCMEIRPLQTLILAIFRIVSGHWTTTNHHLILLLPLALI